MSVWGKTISNTKEAGPSGVHPITKKLASMNKPKNVNRDLFRFVRLPIDVVCVDTVVRVDPVCEEVKPAKLPMFDPHELLSWLHSTGRLEVSHREVEKRDCIKAVYSVRTVSRCVFALAVHAS